MTKIIDLNFQGKHQAIASFVVETTMGPALIETGPYSTFPHLEKGLNTAGYAIEDIQHVFLSHIHFDHAGAAWAFADKGATIYLHPFGKKHLGQPEKLYNSAKRIYGDMMEKLWGEMNPIDDERLHTVEHQNGILLGETTFRAWHTPGHAVHHIAWQVDKTLFAGDVAGVSIAGGPVVPPCPPPDINVEDWMASFALLESLDLDEMYLTHFGKITDIGPHFTELKTILNNWAMWMKPWYDTQTEQKEIVPLFEKYVRNYLQSKGVTGEDLIRFELANPSWMSVAGLMRYWHKKT